MASMTAIFADLFKRYEDPANVDRLRHVQQQTDAVTTVMQSTFEAVLDRGIKVEALRDGTDALAIHVGNYEHAASRLKREMRCRALKTKLLLLAAVVIVLVVVALVFWAIFQGQ
jgi:hypothetical protein